MIDLQIGIPCGPNSEFFTNFLLRSIKKTISRNLSYEILIGINKAGVDKSIITSGIDDFKIKFFERHTDFLSSQGHADCLNLLLDNMTSKWGVFLDADVAMLSKNWETNLIEQLDKQVVMIGSEYHKSDGKIVDRPNVITCAFDVEVFKMIEADFMPSMKSIDIDENNKNIFRKEIGEKVFLDTGCDLIQNLVEKGFETKTLKIVSPRYVETHKDLKVLSPRQRGEEYHLNKIPISTHIGRSLTRNFNNDPIIKDWKKSVEEWLNGQI